MTTILAEHPEQDDLISAARRTIELIFFAHIDQASRADQMLAELNIGRAHHRVLYFCSVREGINVGELASILRISNQALARTINQLISLNLLEQRHSPVDRRVRQQYLTDEGRKLLKKVTSVQLEQVLPALKSMPTEVRNHMWQGLEALCRGSDLVWVDTAGGLPADE